MIFVPTGVCFEHGVQNGEHFSHGRNECDFVFFSLTDKAIEKNFERGVTSYCTERCHGQGRPHVGATAFDATLAGFCAAVATHGCDTDQGGNFAAVERAKFGKRAVDTKKDRSLSIENEDKKRSRVR